MTKYLYPYIPDLCKCGCGEIVSCHRNMGHYPEYIKGHGRRGKYNTELQKLKSSQKQKGQKRPQTTGDKNPAKRPEVRAKLSGENNHFYGKHHTKESIEQMVKSNQEIIFE